MILQINLIFKKGFAILWFCPSDWSPRLRAVSYFSLQSYCTRNQSTRVARPLVARNEGVNNNIVVCNRAGWEKNWTDFKRKGGPQAVYWTPRPYDYFLRKWKGVIKISWKSLGTSSILVLESFNILIDMKKAVSPADILRKFNVCVCWSFFFAICEQAVIFHCMHARLSGFLSVLLSFSFCFLFSVDSVVRFKNTRGPSKPPGTSEE